MNNKPTWTLEDEQQLQALYERKAQFELLCREPLACYIREKYSWLKSTTPEQKDSNTQRLTDWLMANADIIRDLLAPFDSRKRDVESGK